MDTLNPTQRSERMSLVRARDSKPEMAVRRLVHGMGYRYRLHDKRLPGTPDLVFRPRRRVIFVHGCFWHRHPDSACKLARLPKTGLDFWEPKLRANRDRDIRCEAELEAMGWQFFIVWECRMRDSEQLKNDLRSFLEG